MIMVMVILKVMIIPMIMIILMIYVGDHGHDYTHGDHYCRSRGSRNVPTTSISGTTGGTQVGMDHEKGQFQQFVESKILFFFSLSICGNPDPKFLSVSVALPCSPWLGLPLYKVRSFLIFPLYKVRSFLIIPLYKVRFFSNLSSLQGKVLSNVSSLQTR